MRQNRRRIAFVASLASMLALAACGKAPQPAPQEQGSSDATPGAIAAGASRTVTLGDAVIHLPLVAGNPGVAYFTLTQPSGAARRLVSVAVEGAGRAEMHQSKTVGGVSSMDPVNDIAIEPGKVLTFAPGGYHVMLFDFDKTLKPGATRKLTATLDNGDKATVMAKVESGAGEAMDHMEGM